MIFWMFLAAGILSEVIGTTTMRALVFTSPVYGQIAASVSMSLSYFFIAKAVVKIPLGIAYAVWCGAGLAVISFLSWFFFDEPMPPLKIFGLVIIAAGMIMLNLAEENAECSGNGLDVGQAE